MPTKNRDELTAALTAALGALMSDGVSLEDILRAAAAAVAENEGVRPSAAVCRMHYLVHCMRDELDAHFKGM